MADELPPLTEQQLRFCREYAADPSNATRAYRRAYPHCSYNTARVEASKLLTQPNIEAEIEASRREYTRHCRVAFARIVREIAAIAHADPDDVWEAGPEGSPRLRPWGDIPPAARKAIQSIKVRRKRLRGGGGRDDATEWEVEDVEVKHHSKDAALDKLCRHLGITKDGAAVERLLELIEGRDRGPGGTRTPAAVPGGGEAGGPPPAAG